MSIRTCLAAAIAAGLASAASADTVRLQFVNTGAGQNVRFTLGTNSPVNCFAGQLNHAFSLGTGVAAGTTGTHATFCTDLTEHTTSGGAVYTVAPIANLPQTSGWPAMGSQRAQGVYNLYAAANGQQFGTDNNFAAAFQVALWEVAYDFNGTLASLNLGSGNLVVTQTSGAVFSGAMLTDLNMLFAAAAGPGAGQNGLLGLSNDGAQDQIYQTAQVVPLPHAAWAGLAGLALAMGIKRRHSRR